MIQQFKSARAAGCPLIAIQTADPAFTIQNIMGIQPDPPPAIIQWDMVRGLVGLTPAGIMSIQDMAIDPMDARDLPSVLARIIRDPDIAAGETVMQRFPAEGMILVLGAQMLIDQPPVRQALWNARDAFKADGRTVVLLMAGHATIPPDLQHDILSLEEPLPTEEQLGIVADKIHADVQMVPTQETRARAIEAVSGLSGFAAETAVAMSLRSTGLDMDRLWARKRQAIEAIDGLGFSIGGPTFAEVGGLDQIKARASRIFQGPEPPRIVAWVDEIEKLLAGEGDLSGVSQDQMAILLKSMEDYGWTGILAVGHPGSGKSYFAKTLGATFGRPVFSVDFGAAKGSLMGESEHKIRAMMAAIKAAGDGRVLWVATANKLTTIPPALRRRFRKGIYFFDLPTRVEKDSIWPIYRSKYAIPADEQQPSDAGWTGANIRDCCANSYEERCSLMEAAESIVPVTLSSPEDVLALRQLASGRFLSTNHPGAYRLEDSQEGPSKVSLAPAQRHLKLTE